MRNWLVAFACFGALIGMALNKEEGVDVQDNIVIGKPKMRTIIKTFGPGYEKTETTEYDNDEKSYSEEIVFNNSDVLKPPTSFFDQFPLPLPIDLALPSIEDDKRQMEENNNRSSFEDNNTNPLSIDINMPMDIPMPIPIVNPIIIIKKKNLKGVHNPFSQQRSLSPFGLFFNDILSDIAATIKQERNQMIIPQFPDETLSTNIELTTTTSNESINDSPLLASKDKESIDNTKNVHNDSIVLPSLQINKNIIENNPKTNSDLKNVSLNYNYKQIIVFALLCIIIIFIIQRLFTKMFTKSYTNFSINSIEDDEIKTLKLNKTK